MAVSASPLLLWAGRCLFRWTPLAILRGGILSASMANDLGEPLEVEG